MNPYNWDGADLFAGLNLDGDDNLDEFDNPIQIEIDVIGGDGIIHPHQILPASPGKYSLGKGAKSHRFIMNGALMTVWLDEMDPFLRKMSAGK